MAKTKTQMINAEIDGADHTTLKHIAIKKGVTLKSIIDKIAGAAVRSYVKKNK